MPSNNSKYYVKKTNKVVSKNIKTLLKQKSSDKDDCEEAGTSSKRNRLEQLQEIEKSDSESNLITEPSTLGIASDSDDDNNLSTPANPQVTISQKSLGGKSDLRFKNIEDMEKDFPNSTTVNALFNAHSLINAP